MPGIFAGTEENGEISQVDTKTEAFAGSRPVPFRAPAARLVPALSHGYAGGANPACISCNPLAGAGIDGAGSTHMVAGQQRLF